MRGLILEIINMKRQQIIDTFYKAKGACCAGCDWWRHYNSVVGDCTKSAPVSGAERVGMLDIGNLSLDFAAGHVLTKRDHVCGDFVDTYDWGQQPRSTQV